MNNFGRFSQAKINFYFIGSTKALPYKLSFGSAVGEGLAPPACMKHNQNDRQTHNVHQKPSTFESSWKLGVWGKNTSFKKGSFPTEKSVL